MSKARLIVIAGVVFLIAGTVYLQCGACSSNARSSIQPEKVTVKVTMNLDDLEPTSEFNKANTPWYWTQFHLPSHGDLSLLSSQGEYDDDWKRWGGLFQTYCRGGVKYIGKFCCAETVPGRYVFRPTDGHQDRDKLVFFASDGKVWVISVPSSIRTKQRGETTATALVY